MAVNETDMIHDKIPEMVYNKHTTYENSVLNEHGTILNALKDVEAREAVLEGLARHFIGLCLRKEADDFIESNYQKIYNKEYKRATGDNDTDKVTAATTRTWQKLINDASAECICRYKVDGTISRLAVIDDQMADGKRIVELELPTVEFEEDDQDFRKGAGKPAYVIKDIFGAFIYARWVAKQITNTRKNVDRKIFIVGDSGDGKSVTGLALAIAIDRWVAYYVNEQLAMQNLPATAKPGDYFKFDNDHIAVISTDDLLHVQSVDLPQYSIKIIDDCGAAKGFTNRRSMSEENLDVVSIIGTNRVKNGVTIVCIQTEYFTDVRMRLLANDKIDLTGYTSGGRENTNAGLIRIGKLYKMRRDKKKKNKVNEGRFMTFDYNPKTKEHRWAAIEGICCFMPDQKILTEYNELRLLKEKENTLSINQKYRSMKEQEQIKDERPKCPHCNSPRLYYGKKGVRCLNCGRPA